MMASTTRRSSPAADVAVLLTIGIALGLAYNALGLREGNAWGLAWKGVDLVKELEQGPVVEAVEAEPTTPYVSDDPLAIPAVPQHAVPKIPDVGRPVQIHLAAVKQLFDADAMLLIDAREDWEHDEGHIPGSINLPHEEAITDPARLEQLDTGGRPIVTYCGGGSCELSLSLAWELLGVGHTRVAVYMGGYPEWEQAGYPVTKPADAP